MCKRRQDLWNAIVDDQPDTVTELLSKLEDPNVILTAPGVRVPAMLRHGLTGASLAAFLGCLGSFRVFINFGFDPHRSDSRGRTVAHYACAGGTFGILRELDSLSVNWVIVSKDGTPAEMAASFGRLPVLQWLWTKGALLAKPVVGWRDDRLVGDASILRCAAEGGHSPVIEFLIRDVEIPVFRGSGAFVDTILHAACRHGQTETVRALLRLEGPCDAERLCSWSGLIGTARDHRRPWGADQQWRLRMEYRISALGEAALAGALNCALLLLPRFEYDTGEPAATPLAALRGHTDVLKALLTKWPDGGREEALALAICGGHAQCEALLVGTRFGWSQFVVRRVEELPAHMLEEVVLWFGRTGGVAGGMSGGATTLFAGVRTVIMNCQAPDAIVLTCLKKLGAEWIPAVPALDLSFKNRLNEDSVVAMVGAYRLMYDEWELLLLRMQVGDLKRVSYDLYTHTVPKLWRILLADDVPLRWARYPDHAEYLPVLAMQARSQLEDALSSLEGGSVDLARHHICNYERWWACDEEHCCGWGQPSSDADLLIRRGVTGCLPVRAGP